MILACLEWFQAILVQTLVFCPFWAKVKRGFSSKSVYKQGFEAIFGYFVFIKPQNCQKQGYQLQKTEK